MKKQGNRMIADVGKYLIASNNRRGYVLPIEDGITFEEAELTDEVKDAPHDCVSFGGVFNMKKADVTKANLIKKIYSNDDQIAIMLNKDRSKDDAALYEQMQGWREWFGELVKRVSKA